MSSKENNVFGEPLKPCSLKPMTGFYRDGNCRSEADDKGMHTVCAVMTPEFLEYSRAQGNDLSTPRPEFAFPGLKPGDHWCLCALRWLQASMDGCPPLVVLEATHERTLGLISLNELVKYAWKNNIEEHAEDK
jgi:uncharacterized protein